MPPKSPHPEAEKPKWRKKQQLLAPSDKVAALGRTLMETRRWEIIKKQCKPSATS